MKSIFLTILLSVGAMSHADAADKLKNVHFNVAGVGEVRIIHEVVGEPVIEPERLQIFITCAGAKKSVRAKVIRMCEWTDYTYEPGIKMLTLNVVYGSADPTKGIVSCDPHVGSDTIEIDFSTFCAKK